MLASALCVLCFGHSSVMPIVTSPPPFPALWSFQVLFESQGRSNRTKAVDLEDIKFHQVGAGGGCWASGWRQQFVIGGQGWGVEAGCMGDNL